MPWGTLAMSRPSSFRCRQLCNTVVMDPVVRPQERWSGLGKARQGSFHA